MTAVVAAAPVNGADEDRVRSPSASTDQDAAIAGEADRLGRGIIIVANKWDLMKGQGPEFVKQFDESLRRQLKFLDYAVILHLSAATGERTSKLLEQIDEHVEPFLPNLRRPFPSKSAKTYRSAVSNASVSFAGLWPTLLNVPQ